MTEPLHRDVPGSPPLHYLEWQPPSGPSGVPVLFVHGLLTHAAHWGPMAAALAGGSLRAAPRRCVAPDLRGRGLSAAPKAGYRVADHVADIERVVAAAGLERFLLVGFSVGAAYAAAYTAACAGVPGRVAGLVVGDYPARTRGFGPAVREQYLAEPVRFDGWAEAKAFFRQRISFSDAYWEQVKGDLLHELPDGSVVRWYAPEAVRGLMAEMDDTESWGALVAPGRPLLVLQGGASKALSAEQAERYRALGARVVTIAGVGHDVFAMAPRECLRELRDLLFWLDAMPGQ